MAAAREFYSVAISSRFGRCCARVTLIAAVSLGGVAGNGLAAGESASSASGGQGPAQRTAAAADPLAFEVGYDPFEAEYPVGGPFDAHPAASRVYDPFDEVPQVVPVSNVQPATRPEIRLRRNESAAQLRIVEPLPAASQREPYRLVVQQTEELPIQPAPPSDRSEDPCAAAAEKPLGALTINIQMPDGELPRDFATACWEEIETQAGPFAGARAWPLFTYQWNATCFCHRPLYFEEINLERYGYGCHPCLQPAASAAHFFATVPALPYCMAAECPGECIYTLRHYRPGSCPPWRHHYPPRDGLAALTEGGVWTGLIFLIP